MKIKVINPRITRKVLDDLLEEEKRIFCLNFFRNLDDAYKKNEVPENGYTEDLKRRGLFVHTRTDIDCSGNWNSHDIEYGALTDLGRKFYEEIKKTEEFKKYGIRRDR